MNILHLVAALLIIFSISLSYLFEKRKDLENKKTTYVGYMSAQRDAQSKLEEEFFKIIKQEKEKPKENSLLDSKKKIIEKKEKKPPQEKKNKISKNQKCQNILNIYPLIIEGKKNHPALYNTAKNLLQNLYSNIDLVKDNNFTPILNEMINIGKKQKSEKIFLEKISLLENSLKIPYYKMLKGIKNKKPSLLEHFLANKNETNKICIMHSSYLYLASIFNPKMAEKIISKREKKFKEQINGFTEEEIENIAKQSNFRNFDNSIFDVIELQHKKRKIKKIAVFGYDKKSQISIKKEFFIN